MHSLCAYPRWLFLPGNTEHLSCLLFIPSSLPLTIPQTLRSLLQCYCMTVLEPLLIHFLKQVSSFILVWWSWVCIAARRAFSRCGEQAPLALGARPQWFWSRASSSAARGIFLDRGSNLRPLQWQADSYPLCGRNVPLTRFFK